MKTLLHLPASYPKCTLLLILLISVGLAPGVFLAGMRPVLEGDLPPGDPRVQEDARLKQAFPDRDDYVLDLVCPEGVFTRSCLDWQLGVVAAVEAIEGRSGPVESLYTHDYVWATEDQISVSDLIDRRAELSRDDRAQLRERVRSDPLLAGRLVSRDERSTLVWFPLESDISQQNAYRPLAAIQRKFDDGTHRVHIFGTHFIDEETDVAVARDISRLLPVGLLFIGLIVMATLTWDSIVLLFGVILLSVEWCFGLMGYAGIPRSVLSGSVPLILVAVVSSAGFHLIHRMREEAGRPSRAAGPPLQRREVVIAALDAVGRPVLVAGITSTLGFATLAVFRILSVREFGFYAATGIACGVFLSLSFIPAMVLVFLRHAITRPEGSLARAVAGMLDRILRASTRLLEHPAPVLSVSLILVGVMAMGLFSLRVGSNPPHFFPEHTRVRQGFDALDADFGGDGFVTVMFDAGTPGAALAPAFLKKVQRFSELASREPKVAFGTSVVDTLARLRRKFNGDDPAAERIPDSSEAVAQYLLVYESGAGDSLEHMIDFDRQRLVADFLVDAKDSAILDHLHERMSAIARQVGLGSAAVLAGEFFVWSAQNRYIVTGKLINVAVTFLLIMLVCGVVLRSATAAMMAGIPVASATLVVLGAMGYLDIRLDLASCVITSVVVGVGIDFAIHFLFRLRQEADEDRSPEAALAQCIRTAGPPILHDCCSNLAFIVFAVSAFVPVRNFGWMVCLSMLVSAAGTLVLLPALLKSRARRGA